MRPARRLILLAFIWLMLAVITAGFAMAEAAFESIPSIYPHLLLAWKWLGAALATIALADLFTLRWSKKLAGQREVSQNIAVGASTQVHLKIANPYNVKQKVLVNDHYPEHCEVEGLPFNIQINAKGFTQLTYSLKSFARGDAQFGQIRLLANSKLSLWQRRIMTGEAETVKVYPNFAAIHHYILLSADQQTTQMGIRLSQKRGEGLEFHQLREYRIGDSLRQIDWRATSRLNKLISKEYQEEKDQNIVFLLDCGRRMRAQDDDLSHFDHSLNAMLLLAYIGLKQGDAVGLLSFGGVQRWMSPQKGTHHINTLLNQVYDCHPTLHASDFIEAASELNKRIRKRSLVVLVSNCRDDDMTELEPAIKLLNRHHLVMLANLREQALDDVIETPIRDFQHALQYAETLDFLKQRQKVINHCAAQGVVSLDTVPKHLATRIVNSYFEIKRSGKL